MKLHGFMLGLALLASSTEQLLSGASESRNGAIDSTYLRLADEVKQEAFRSWKAYKQCAWGHDVLKRNSKA